MKLRLIQDDRERFDTLYKLLTKYFQSPLTLLYTRLDASLKPVAWENSTGTDLQACRVLLDAAAKWKNWEYQERALKIAGRILRHNVRHGILINGAAWKERVSRIYSLYEPALFLNLSIIDVQLLLRLQSLLPVWEPVVQRALGILLAGSGGKPPRQHYNVEKKRYTHADQTSTEYLWIMVHMIDGGLVPIGSMDSLMKRAGGDPANLVKTGKVTVASGALTAYIFAKTGHHAASQRILTAMEAHFADENGLLCDPGKPASLGDNLLYLFVKEVLKTKEP